MRRPPRTAFICLINLEAVVKQLMAFLSSMLTPMITFALGLVGGFTFRSFLTIKTGVKSDTLVDSSSDTISTDDYSSDLEEDVSVHRDTIDILLSQQAKTINHLTELLSNIEKVPRNTEIGPSEEVSEDELATLFEEESLRHDRTLQQTLDIGRQIGEEPIHYPVKQGGGYATLDELHQIKKTADEFNKLSRDDESAILQSFSFIQGLQYHLASKMVEKQGYTLHPLYINDEPVNRALTYKGTIIGVKVSDPDYIGQNLTSRAIVESLINIGGRDGLELI